MHGKARVLVVSLTVACIAAALGVAGCSAYLYHHEPPAPVTPVVSKVPTRVLGVVSNDVRGFAQATGTHPNLAVRYISWGHYLPVSRMTGFEAMGMMPLIEIMPRGVTLTQVANGSQDGYLRSLASQARSFRGKLALSFAPEMNGNWYSWDGHPTQFRAAWRHVVTVFRRAGAPGVTWVWIAHRLDDSWKMKAFWPGDSYVSWAGLDGYFEFPGSSFAYLFGPAITEIRSFTQRPILIAETAVGPGARHTGATVRDLFSGVSLYHLRGFVWFDIPQHRPPYHQDWRLEDDPAALRAFRREARNYH